MRNLVKLPLLILALCVFNILNTHSQDVKGFEKITPFLDSMNLDFYFPTENQIRIQSPRKNVFFNYDTRIKIKSSEMEVLIDFHPPNESSFTTLHPHLEFNRLLGNLIPNDDDQEVLVVGWREQKLLEKNADWGAEAYIKPREEISSFPFAKLVSFFKEDKGMVVILYCFNKPDSVPDLLSFQKDL